MRRKIIPAALILIAAVTLTSISVTMGSTVYYPILTASNQGVVWQFSTAISSSAKMFSGKDVDPNSIVAEYWNGAYGEPSGDPITVTPYKISLADSQVKLWFTDLPTSAGKAIVCGSLTTGDSFVATGPGWVWSNVH